MSRVRLAALVGRAASRLGLWGPTPGELASVLPELVDARAVAAQMAGQRFANAQLGRHITRHGSASLSPRVDWTGAEHLAAPAVIVLWHAGVVGAIGAALRALELDATVLRTHAPEPASHIQQVVIGRGVAARAAALQKGVAVLRAGGRLVTVVEATPGGERAQHSFLGRQAHLPEGPAALCRLGHAPLVPVTSQARGGRLAFTAHAPLVLGADPTAAYAAWFDAYYRAHPGELWPEVLVHALRARRTRATPCP